MDQTLQDIRKWIRNHYSDADNALLMQKILQLYAEPIVTALGSIETSSEWMRHDVRELQQSLKLPWTELIDPPPRTMTAAQMEERMRDAVRKTHAIWREEMAQWAKELGDDADAFEVEEADVRALRHMTDTFALLKALKSEESVRKTMGMVVDAAIARRVRKEERRREKVAKRLAKIRAEQANMKRELDARRAAAHEQGMSVGIGKRPRERIEHGMLAARRTAKK